MLFVMAQKCVVRPKMCCETKNVLRDQKCVARPKMCWETKYVLRDQKCVGRPTYDCIFCTLDSDSKFSVIESYEFQNAQMYET